MPPDARFLRIGGRRLFSLHYTPAGPAPLARVLYLPPLLEELNKCRRLSALLGAALCAVGCEFAQLDLSGTGDSAGDFEDARWSRWADELAVLAHELRGAGADAPLILLGLRAGALLLAELRERLQLPVARTVVLQPVLEGRPYIQQLVRVRVMASKFSGTPESPDELKRAWGAGETVELAGYGVHPELAAAMEAATVRPADLRGGLAARLIEFRAGGRTTPSAVYARFAETAASDEIPIELEQCSAEQFWMSQENVAPAAAVAAAVGACTRGL